MEKKALLSFDRTRIVYQVGGAEGCPWLVVANGYGGTFWAFDDLFAELADRHRLLIWDYRGLHGSAIPKDRSKLRIEDHCRDLDRLLEAESIGSMILCGWSVGVQVALEQYRRRPASIDALLLLNGANGRVLQRSLDRNILNRALPAGLRGARRLVPLLERTLLPLARRVATLRAAPTLLRLLGIFNGESPAMQRSAAAVLDLDYDVFLKMIMLADEHDTDDLLGEISTPTLVVGADRDLITHTRVTETMARAIPGAEYFVARGATHYGIMEFPQVYARKISDFLSRSL